MGRKHESIPQFDGETSHERNTDPFWEKNFFHTLKSYGMYKDVLLDIEESGLSKEEKQSECEKVTALRKEGLGKNFSYCPPWNFQ